MAKDALGRRARRQFSEEFKDGAVRLVLDEGKTIGAVARELELTASALAGWVKHARAERTQGKSGLVKEEREELLRLRREVRELRMEREMLKKAAAGSRRRWLGVTPSGFYAWQRRPESARVCDDRRLKVLLHTSFKEGRGYRRQPPRPGRSGQMGRTRQPEADHSLDAGGRAEGACAQTLQDNHRQRSRSTNCRQSAPASLHSRATEPAMGQRHDACRGKAPTSIYVTFFSRRLSRPKLTLQNFLIPRGVRLLTHGHHESTLLGSRSPWRLKEPP
jgi:transposase